MDNGHEVVIQEPGAGPAGFRLSPQQEQLWQAGEPAPLLARCSVDLGGAGEAAARTALAALLDRHEILRTTFVRRPGMKLPSQVIHDRLETGRDEAEIDLAAGPVVVAAFSETGGESRLALTLPAACADARSLVVLATELREALAGREGAGGGEPVQYADYAEWRSEVLSSAEPVEAAALPASPALPFAPRDASAAGPVRAVALALDGAAIVRGAEACRASEAAFLEACWHACLARVAGEETVVVGTVLDGRANAELATAIGPYAQALPLASTIEETTSLVELVDRVARARLKLEQQQDGADAAVLADTARRCSIGFSSVEVPGSAGIGSLVAAPVPFLAELVWIGGDARRAELHVAPALVESGTADLLAQTLAAIVAGGAADPDAAVLDLPVTAADGPRAAFAGTPARGDGETVAARFERMVAEAPHADAVVAADGTLSYAELNARANRLAHRLRSLGVGRGSVVSLCMERSTHSIVALLATLKAGGAYLPLNFEHPPARLAHQIAEAESRVLLAESSVADRLPPFDRDLVVVDADESLGEEPDSDPPHVNDADDLVYVMYTSGSTGTPKGAGITHRNLVNYAAGVLDRLGPDGGDRATFGAVSALSTDLGNTSIFAALLGGGTLHLVPPADALDGERFAAYVRANPLDVLKITPSHLRTLLDAGEPAAVLPRRWLVLGGEALPWQLADRIEEARPQCRILNHYGPTETTVGTCTFEVDSGSRQGATVPIGTPLPGTHAYVVDRQLRLVPPGVPGELCIGGVGVARGYVGRPDETAARFVPDPFADEPDARMYRTGDRVRALADGSIEFLGRVDDQVKIRGYRVEPGEVERVLAAHPAVRQAAVVARADADGGNELLAYVVHARDASTDELQRFLRDSVPAYMVPSRFVRVDALPLTPSGKIDRRSLPDPGELEREVEYVAPRTPLEEELARIWEDLLGVERVGVNDDFFALGGHSLLATQAVIRIRNAVADIPLHSLFNAPTVAALAQAIVDAELAVGDRRD